MGNGRQRSESRRRRRRLPVPYAFSTNHQNHRLNYLWLALFSVFLGMAMSLLMRIHLVWPERISVPLSLGNFRGIAVPPSPCRPCDTHGSLMVFLVLTRRPGWLRKTTSCAQIAHAKWLPTLNCSLLGHK